jgi:hypothetical protein
MTEEELNRAKTGAVLGTSLEVVGATAAWYLFWKHVAPRFVGGAFVLVAILLSPVILVITLLSGEVSDEVIPPLIVVALPVLVLYAKCFRWMATTIDTAKRREQHVSNFPITQDEHKALKVVLNLVRNGDFPEVVQVRCPGEWAVYEKINGIRARRAADFDRGELETDLRLDQARQTSKLIQAYSQSGYTEAELRQKFPEQWTLNENASTTTGHETAAKGSYGWGDMIFAIVIACAFFAIVAFMALK